MFYDYDGTLSRDESGYLFNFQDRREEAPLKDTTVNLTGLVSIKPNCEKYMMCGMPLYDFRFVDNRLQSKWLPRSEPVEPPGSTKLELLSKTVLNSTTARLEFNLTGPAQMNIFIQPYEDVEITDWSFLREYLDNPPKYPLSYHICIHYGIDSSPINFFIDVLVRYKIRNCQVLLILIFFHCYFHRKVMVTLRYLSLNWVYPVTMWEKRVMPIVNSWHLHFPHSLSYLSGLPYIKDTFFSFSTNNF